MKKMKFLPILVLASGLFFSACSSNQELVDSLQADLNSKTTEISSLKANLESKESALESAKAAVSEKAAEVEACQKSKVGTSSASNVNTDLFPPNAKPGECYARVLIPATYKTTTEKVIKREASERLEVIPATYKWGTEKVLVREASTKVVPVPATYKWETERVLVKAASSKLVNVPAKYEWKTEKILEKPNDGKINVKRIVRYITGLSAADIERLGRMAALSVIEQGKKVITEEILIEQINIIKYGHKIENQMIKNLELEMKMTAYHEASHAVLSYLLLPDVKIEQITISPRSKTLGFVSYTEQDQIATVTKEEIFHDICVMMAGQAAKMKKAGKKTIDTGAGDDLYQASFQAYNAIAVLGMDKELGFINTSAVTQTDIYFLSEKIEKRFLKWIHEAEKITVKLIDEHWNQIEKLAMLLIEKEVVENDELVTIMGKQKPLSVLPATL